MLRELKSIPKPELAAILCSVGVGVLLLVVKFIAYFLTRSSAIFSDAMESIVNVLASLVAAYALWLAHRPADRDHPYGHGKVEFLSAGFEGGMILLAALVIAARTLDVLIFHPIEVQKLGWGLALVSLAMVINGIVGVYLIRIGRRRSSATLEADGHHLLSDAITSAAALIALAIVTVCNWSYADPIAALLIAVYIAWMGAKLLRRSAAGLMDEQDLEDEKVLRALLDGHIGDNAAEPRICSYHKLRHRHSGRYHWIDFHIMVRPNLTVAQGHEIASALEWEIEQKLGVGQAKASAHVEPCPDAGCGA